jgi:5-methylcytosine-specific restriction protein A
MSSISTAMMRTRLGNNPFQPAGRRSAKRAHTLCLDCEATGCVTATYFTNHVEPHKVDMMLFWNSEQWQPACTRHHGLVKQLLEAMFA